MKDLIIPVNNEAHSRALTALFGPEKAQEFLKAYQAIDSAMAFGYERATADAAEASKKQAEEYVEALQRSEDRDHKEAFKQGYDAGFNDGADGRQDVEKSAYDYGYVDGVSDARMSPSDADRIVEELCSADEAEVDDYDDQADEDGFDGRYDDFYHEWAPCPTFDYDDTYEPKLNAAVEGEWTPEACSALDGAFNDARTDVLSRRDTDDVPFCG